MGRQSKSELRKQEILSHLYDLIIDEGFENISIKKIAQRMEINPSLIMHYFETKEIMVAELVDYLFSTYSKHIIPDLSQSESPEERLNDFLEIIFTINWDGVINNKVFFTYVTLALRRLEITEPMRNAFGNLFKVVKNELKLAGKAKVLPEQDWDLASEFILTLMEGCNVFEHISPLTEYRQRKRDAMKAAAYSALKAGKWA